MVMSLFICEKIRLFTSWAICEILNTHLFRFKRFKDTSFYVFCIINYYTWLYWYIKYLLKVQASKTRYVEMRLLISIEPCFYFFYFLKKCSSRVYLGTSSTPKYRSTVRGDTNIRGFLYLKKGVLINKKKKIIK